jgi:hypothetical protein
MRVRSTASLVRGAESVYPTLVGGHYWRPETVLRYPISSASPSSSRLAGYEDTNDAKGLAEDPTFRMLASPERREASVALTSTLRWFETEVLAESETTKDSLTSIRS